MTLFLKFFIHFLVIVTHNAIFVLKNFLFLILTPLLVLEQYSYQPRDCVRMVCLIEMLFQQKVSYRTTYSTVTKYVGGLHVCDLMRINTSFSGSI